jgi:hypothetical protein
LTRPRVSLLAMALVVGEALGAGPGASPPPFEREIPVDAAGRVAVRLDRDVYEGARRDLGDLRVLDESGREVPYAIDRVGARRRGEGVPGDGWPPRHEERLEVRWSEVQDTGHRETWLAIDLGARHQPLEAVVLDVADERFFREVRVDALRDPRVSNGASFWEEIGRGQVHRLERGGRRRECLRIEARGRERSLRVRIRNRDDRPLRVLSAAALVPVERLLFEAAGPGLYRLTYGSADRAAPSYDLVRTAGDLDVWAETARPGKLGPLRRLAAPVVVAPPWTERHPALLWAGLLAVVLALGGLTLAALRRAA